MEIVILKRETDDIYSCHSNVQWNIVSVVVIGEMLSVSKQPDVYIGNSIVWEFVHTLWSPFMYCFIYLFIYWNVIETWGSRRDGIAS